MNHRTCNTIVKILNWCCYGLLFVAIITRSKLFLILGLVPIVVGIALRWKFWKCPHCAHPLPWGKIQKDHRPYRCENCGKEFEL